MLISDLCAYWLFLATLLELCACFMIICFNTCASKPTYKWQMCRSIYFTTAAWERIKKKTKSKRYCICYTCWIFSRVKLFIRKVNTFFIYFFFEMKFTCRRATYMYIKYTQIHMEMHACMHGWKRILRTTKSRYLNIGCIVNIDQSIVSRKTNNRHEECIFSKWLLYIVQNNWKYYTKIHNIVWIKLHCVWSNVYHVIDLISILANRMLIERHLLSILLVTVFSSAVLVRNVDMMINVDALWISFSLFKSLVDFHYFPIWSRVLLLFFFFIRRKWRS